MYFLNLCERRSTGSRKDLAKRLEMSDSGIKRMINDLRDAGLLIEYSHEDRSYIRVKQSWVKDVFLSD